MADPNRTGASENVSTIQSLQNTSYDRQFGVAVTEPLGFDGQNLQRNIADATALKMVTDGSVLYIAIASPGSAATDAKWQCKKIDKTSGIVITYADGNSNFDNKADNLTGLSYS